jgi:hypothetical protein
MPMDLQQRAAGSSDVNSVRARRAHRRRSTGLSCPPRTSAASRVQSELDGVPEALGQWRQRVFTKPGDGPRLVVADRSLTSDRPAKEGCVEVLDTITVGIGRPRQRLYPHETFDHDRNAGLFQHLTDDPDIRILIRFECSTDRCPLTVVGSLDQENLTLAVIFSHDNSGHPRAKDQLVPHK